MFVRNKDKKTRKNIKFIIETLFFFNKRKKTIMVVVPKIKIIGKIRIAEMKSEMKSSNKKIQNVTTLNNNSFPCVKKHVAMITIGIVNRSMRIIISAS